MSFPRPSQLGAVTDAVFTGVSDARSLDIHFAGGNKLVLENAKDRNTPVWVHNQP